MSLIKNSEIAILILSTNDKRYSNFISAIESSWLKKFQENGIKCFFYSGNAVEKSIVDNHIRLDCPDELAHTSEKLRMALDVLRGLVPELKVVYRTNLSSYIDYENFIKFVHEKDIDENSYLGLKGDAGYWSEYFYRNKILHNLLRPLKFLNKIYFASGSGLFLGANHLKKIVESTQYDEFIDDIMLGLILKGEFSRCDAPCRFDIQEDAGHKISKDKYLNLVREKLLFHYRFKTSNRNSDAQLIAQFSDPGFRLMTCTLDD